MADEYTLDERDLFKEIDPYSDIRKALGYVAVEKGWWAGIPTPVTGLSLKVEANFHRGKELMEVIDQINREKLGEKETETLEQACEREGIQIINWFYLKKHKVEVIIYRDKKDNKVRKFLCNDVTPSDLLLTTLSASIAWGIDQERKALEKFHNLVSDRQFREYVLTGMFLEKSKRSGVWYLFRKVKPTIAYKVDNHSRKARILCALCLHPIGYYDDSWAGVMCPTDDVIAHLLMMRGDEHMFWRRSNQHQPYVPQSGL